MGVFLSAIAPVALIMLIGWLTTKYIDVDYATLSKLSIYVLVPALIADSLSKTTITPSNALRLASAVVLMFGILYILAKGITIAFKIPANPAKSMVSTTLFSNLGNLGLPFVAFSLGEEALERAVLVLVFTTILMVILGPAILKNAGIGVGLKVTVKMPLFWALIAGILLKITGYQLPLNLGEGIKIMGNAAIPIALIMLGVQLARTQFGGGWYELLACAMRLLLGPLVAIAMGLALNLQGLDLQVLIIESSMPAAINNLVWVSEFGGDRELVTKTILLSTIFSFFTLPLILKLVTSNYLSQFAHVP
ncbi:MAG: AEC family transporter [Synechococcaceae cyanobacterium RL_1_2]|nr:AEC family transporter [Synechococcaceae cyanobacterium RL_1_2]